ncbi:MarR family winged helix-turn-helix transcriptional regulator [Sinomonas atrocyanea]|jgi:DNA-binding MarR family transcriptional regulator|uniref:MarR family winged helix-turn-helix transcriptional regulator n=1 Tax=Sinomonas atrocyanea TaxID=37927 RepID=UPI0027825851|nr:MarR family transcriptional regulator [Sinomonas atrocyanea]MDQ0260621.1 DNA-binding MarR family transcriptional regulator [Sinomonas atrocyanea]MDR6621374.1 DNA-binding MarR family transcriptional regulator [Sinomonas atrocyanea]
MPSARPSDPQLVGRFSLLLEQLVRRLRTISSVGGISTSAASALGRLGAEGPLRVTELAQAEGVSQPAMTQLVGRMTADGLLERMTAEGDRRGVLVGVTARGRDVLGQRRARRVAFLDELLGGLDPADRAAVAAALPALERLVGSDAPPSRGPDQRENPDQRGTPSQEEEDQP